MKMVLLHRPADKSCGNREADSEADSQLCLQGHFRMPH